MSTPGRARLRLRLIVTSALFVACTHDGGCCEPSIVPEPIPARFQLPVSRNELQQKVDENDTYAMTEHAWHLWAGITARSSSTYESEPLPIWETWLATHQVFTKSPTMSMMLGFDAPAREFGDPAQFFHRQADGTPIPDEADSSLVGSNKFDPTMTEYLWAGHASPSATGQDFFYTSKASLSALNESWPPGTQPIDRTIADAPNTAVELKPVMLWVAQTGLTAIPFWQGPKASTASHCQGVNVQRLRHPKPGEPATECHPEPTTWTSCVLIDPAATTTGLTPGTKEQYDAADRRQAPDCSDWRDAQYGGIDMLHGFAMTEAEANAYNEEQEPPSGSHAVKGDYAVLVAMHVNTKEIEDWTWQTFWWQGGQDSPDSYPGSSTGMTDDVEGVWRNYNSCNAYSQTTKPHSQGEMRVCFNPYLETSTGIPDGLRSNCVTCHGTARVPKPLKHFYPPSYDAPISFDEPHFYDGEAVTRTDFSWAIPLESN